MGHGRRGVDDQLQAREVVALAHGRVELEHPHEHGRDELAVGDAGSLCISASASSASKRSITTTGAPMRWMVMQLMSGAEWYSGAGDR